MDKNFEIAFKEILGFEVGNSKNGGYVNDPLDRGGETKYGITKSIARKAGYTGKMIDLTIEDAKEIYYKFFWKQWNYDKIKNSRIATEMFDQCVNMGFNSANKNLQEAYNLLERGSMNDLLVDGIIGPKTLRCVNEYPYQKDLLQLLNILQGKNYIQIIKNNPSQDKYFRGWLKRTRVYWSN